MSHRRAVELRLGGLDFEPPPRLDTHADTSQLSTQVSVLAATCPAATRAQPPLCDPAGRFSEGAEVTQRQVDGSVVILKTGIKMI